MPSVALRSVLAITPILACLAVCGSARADADPASDVLYTDDVFLPFSTIVSPGLAGQLADATRAASDAGKPVRVALIAAPADLGGIPSLFGKPTDYARFLGLELQFVYTGRVLIVMPQGPRSPSGVGWSRTLPSCARWSDPAATALPEPRSRSFGS